MHLVLSSAVRMLISNILDKIVESLVREPLESESSSPSQSCLAIFPIPMGSKIRCQIVISCASLNELNRRKAFNAIN